MISYFFENLPHFLAYFAAALAAVLIFLSCYVVITPHREFELIAQGNLAAAAQLTGTFLGFSVAMAVVIGHSVSILDLMLWGGVAALVQLAVFFALSRVLFRTIEQRITENCAASGIFVGGIGLGVGILQAACMIP